MRYVFKKRKLFLAFIALVVTIILVHSDMNARGTNDFIEKKNILRVLHEETTENFTSTAIVDCDYHNIIYDDATLPKIITDDNLNYGHRIKIGGEFAPHECNAKFSTAIIVPYRFILHYSKQFGGALAIMTKHFISINGMSNKYFGWDGGDDDLFARLESLKFTLCRFEPGISKYQKNVSNRPQGKWYSTKEKLLFTKQGMVEDGLNSLKYTEVATVLHPLFTHIMVDL